MRTLTANPPGAATAVSFGLSARGSSARQAKPAQSSARNRRADFFMAILSPCVPAPQSFWGCSCDFLRGLVALHYGLIVRRVGGVQLGVLRGVRTPPGALQFAEHGVGRHRNNAGLRQP